jgi:hypothetical protein
MGNAEFMSRIIGLLGCAQTISRTAQSNFGGRVMRRTIGTSLLLLCFFGLALPFEALAQNGRDREYRSVIRRDKNGVRLGDDRRIRFLDGEGLVTYQYRDRWMYSPAGAATVIGIGAGAGAVTGGVVKGKKGAVVGALVGGAAATGVWLYKNRWRSRRIF